MSTSDGSHDSTGRGGANSHRPISAPSSNGPVERSCLMRLKPGEGLNVRVKESAAQPCGVDDAVLVDVVPSREFRQSVRQNGICRQRSASPDRGVVLVERLHLLDTCEIAAKCRLLAEHLNRLGALPPVGIGVHRKLNRFDVARILPGSQGVEPDHDVVQSGASIVQTVADPQPPLGVRSWQVEDAEYVVAHLRVDFDSDAVVVTLLEGVDLWPEDVEVLLAHRSFSPARAR